MCNLFANPDGGDHLNEVREGLALVAGFLSGWLGLAALCSAAEIRITLPDAQLRSAIKDDMGWYHSRCRDVPELTAQIRCVVDELIRFRSVGHYSGLASLQATMTIHLDHEPD